MRGKTKDLCIALCLSVQATLIIIIPLHNSILSQPLVAVNQAVNT